jgi:NADH dehydrogenase
MSEIAQPIRAIMRAARNVTVRLDEAVSVDLPGRRLLLAEGSALPYDILVDASEIAPQHKTSQLHSTFPERLSAYALKALQRMGVEVRLSTPVDTVDANGVGAGNERIEAGLVIWCAGVRGSSAGSWLGVPPTRHGTMPVSPDLSIAGHPEVLIAGDLAHVGEQSGGPLPQLAAVGKQQGAFVARVIDARRWQGSTCEVRVSQSRSLTIIGRSSAVVDFGWLHLTGVPAWLAWALAHIFFLIGFRNWATVFVEWAWEWFTYKRGARLFVDRPAERFAVTRPSSSVD